MKWTKADILDLEKFYRRNLINSLLGFKPALLIGTSNNQGQHNLAIFSQVFHVGATPPLLGILFRPDSVERHTLSNIRETGFFTVNQVSEGMEEQAHQTSARYANEISEFEAVGLTAEMKDDFFAPFVQESPLKIACSLVQENVLEINGTIMVIGAIESIEVNENAVLSDGFIDHVALQNLAAVGLDAYYLPQKLARFSYAKPDIKPKQIDF
jgi:flavin reductase (DIM6/NTAB) family NADH-FMN oxidoreductase RutF